jgi:hypothetical protein
VCARVSVCWVGSGGGMCVLINSEDGDDWKRTPVIL